MSTANNHLCYLIAKHGRRAEVITGKTKKSLKRVAIKLAVFVPVKETPKDRIKRRDTERWKAKRGEYGNKGLSQRDEELSKKVTGEK